MSKWICARYQNFFRLNVECHASAIIFKKMKKEKQFKVNLIRAINFTTLRK